MPLYFVLVNIESVVESDTETLASETMSKFGFGKIAETDDGIQVSLAPWLYSGISAEDDISLSRRLCSMLHLALGKELNLIVIPGERFHVAHTQGSMLGISDIDPDRR